MEAATSGDPGPVLTAIPITAVARPSYRLPEEPLTPSDQLPKASQSLAVPASPVRFQQTTASRRLRGRTRSSSRALPGMPSVQGPPLGPNHRKHRHRPHRPDLESTWPQGMRLARTMARQSDRPLCQGVSVTCHVVAMHRRDETVCSVFGADDKTNGVGMRAHSSSPQSLSTA